MASFCSNCGAPVNGRFCTACGASIAGSPAPAGNPTPPAPPAFQPVAAPAATRTSSGVKILLIVLGVVMLLGAAGVGGIVYVGYRAKQKLTQLKQEYAVDGDASSSSPASTRTFPPSQGSGCSLLEGQEAAGILGVAVERAESEAASDQGTLCKYWVSAAERQRFVRREIAQGVAGLDKADTKIGQQDLEKLIGGAAGALIEANGDNKNTDYAFSLQVWRQNGKEQWDKIEQVQGRTKDVAGADVAGVAMQPVEGVGDRATVLAAGHSMMVLKGDTFFLLGFQQFVPGRDKTAALARVVAGRL